jgi:hypothetical protein
LIILERILLNNLQYYLIEKNIFSKNNLVIINNNTNIDELLNDIKKAKIYSFL